MLKRRRSLFLLLPALWMIGIYYLSSLTATELNAPSIPHIDKIAHTVVYCGLVLSFVAWGWRRPLSDWLPLAIGTAMSFALFDELHQLRVPSRHLEWLDLAADGAGILLGTLFILACWSQWPPYRMLHKEA